MKTRLLIPSAALVCLLICFGVVRAQTVTIGAIPGSHFCAGDSIAISFTAAGFFGHKNVFTLQLSDTTGSFSNGFQNLASLADTLPGTFTIHTTLPYSEGTHYRFRIMAAVPYTTSADNGSDLTIGAAYWLMSYGADGPGTTGIPITFYVTDDLMDPRRTIDYTVHWDFGAGATPATATVNARVPQSTIKSTATYSTPGHKIATLRYSGSGGCLSKNTDTVRFDIFDCSSPSLPHDAIVVNSDTMAAESSKTYWVNPGFTLSFADSDTIFAEPGSTIGGPHNCVIYLKPGAVFNSSRHAGGNSVIFGNGASVNYQPSDFTMNCRTFDFDYSTAPPNVFHPTSSVKSDLNSVPITLSPNPTNGMLSVQGLPSGDVTVSVYNALGETVMMRKNPPASEFTLDLSKLLAGTYYIRFSSANSVITKKVIRE